MSKPLSKRSFFIASIGTMVEYYDHALFILYLPILAPYFIPGVSTYDSLSKGFVFLGITMLARPLGGLFFGHIGDIISRRAALLTSMYGIAIATFIVGITPGYELIGWGGVIIFGIAKSVQVFCFGGEYNGAGIYIIEHAKSHREALMGSLLTAITLVGSLIATLIGAVLSLHFMPDYSWRFAFILGGVFGVIGIIFRRNLTESPNFKPGNKKEHSFKQLIKKYPRELVAGVYIGGFATLPFMTVMGFINPVLATQGFMTNYELMILQSVLIFVAIITVILSGYYADKFTPAYIMKFSCLLLIALSYPLLVLIDNGNFFWIIIGEISFIIINEILLGPSNAFLKNLFEPQFRYRATSFSYCTGISLIGWLTPMIENKLYQYTSSFSSASLWLVFIGLGTLISIQHAKKRKKKPIIIDTSTFEVHQQHDSPN